MTTPDSEYVPVEPREHDQDCRAGQFRDGVFYALDTEACRRCTEIWRRLLAVGELRKAGS